MKTYIVEDKIINLETKEVVLCYLGKDGYVHDDMDYCEGYTRPVYAYDLIKRQFDNIIIVKLDNTHGLEGKWLHIYNVIEYVKSE